MITCINEFKKILEAKSFSSEFYNRELYDSYLKKPYNDTSILDADVKTLRYDILAHDLLKEFGVKTTSKYFAFLINLENEVITSAFGANSGSQLMDFTKASKSWATKYTAVEFYNKIKNLNIPAYIRE